MRLDDSSLDRFAKALREDHELLFSDGLIDGWLDDGARKPGPVFWIVVVAMISVVVGGIYV